LALDCRCDHLLSHVLAAISNAHGGQGDLLRRDRTCPYVLARGGLSEDVDLIAVGSRAETAAAVEKTLRSALRRSHGRIAWAPALTAIRDTDAAVLVADDGPFSVRIQLLDRLGYELWPTSMQAIEQRYRDAPAASLRVRTAAAFAAWKTVAWHDRGAPRDLYDLWALAQRGAITAEAAALFVAHGPINRPLQPWMFAFSARRARTPRRPTRPR